MSTLATRQNLKAYLLLCSIQQLKLLGQASLVGCLGSPQERLYPDVLVPGDPAGQIIKASIPDRKLKAYLLPLRTSLRSLRVSRKRWVASDLWEASSGSAGAPEVPPAPPTVSTSTCVMFCLHRVALSLQTRPE